MQFEKEHSNDRLKAACIKEQLAFNEFKRPRRIAFLPPNIEPRLFRE